VAKVNEKRMMRDEPPLPPIVPHTVRRTYISLMLEAGAPLHYVMDQVGHEDSKTTLEIYATVQKRLSRPQVKRAFEALLAASDLDGRDIPAEARAKMSPHSVGGAKERARRSA
jgi:integrase